jgi:hypothetical protein
MRRHHADHILTREVASSLRIFPINLDSFVFLFVFSFLSEILMLEIV